MATQHSTQLETILATTRASVAAAKVRVSIAELERRAAEHQPRGFAAALRRQAVLGPAVIAEIKKASPSKGLIRGEFDVEWLAQSYQAGGAVALSVLTDEPYFQGSLRNLELASAATPIPCLRKDFMVDEFQLLEARANCADAILLIVAALPQAELIALARRAQEHGLDVLCEAHNREELNRAIDAGCELIGVNNRDLRTFKVDIETSVGLAEFMPKDVVCVAESGIHSGADIAHLRSAGYHGFLIAIAGQGAASFVGRVREQNCERHAVICVSENSAPGTENWSYDVGENLRDHKSGRRENRRRGRRGRAGIRVLREEPAENWRGGRARDYFSAARGSRKGRRVCKRP
jgi:indole-3-glycerol phosphate synthase